MENTTAPVIIKGEYKGSLRCEMTHLKSNNTIMTDAPTDNHGKGEAFSPTDTVCGALAACMMTIIGITAQAHDFNVDGTKYEIKKTMAQNPRRIGQIDIAFTFPKNDYTDKQKEMLKKAAETCPVAQTLSKEVIVNITWNF